MQLSQSLEQRKMASADLLCRDLQQLVDEFIIDRSSVQPYVDGIAMLSEHADFQALSKILIPILRPL